MAKEISAPDDYTERIHERYPPSIDGERLIHVFTQLVEPIGRSLPSTSEVILHDLSRLPNSIVAVYGDLTARTPGSPATDTLLRAAVSGALETAIGYETHLPDGRVLRSSTMVIRDVADQPVAALCINSDVSVWQAVHQLAASMIDGVGPTQSSPVSTSSTMAAVAPLHGASPAPAAAAAPGPGGEAFVRDVDELASLLLQQAIAEAQVPVELMRKQHKLDVVRTLRSRGMFLLRDSVETVAAALHVTRFTIYNYLNELPDDDDAETAAVGRL